MNATPTGFGLAHLWTQGDTVIRTITVLLLFMSVVSWVVIALKALNLRRHLAQTRQIDAFWHSRDFVEGMSRFSSRADNPFYLLACQGYDAARHFCASDEDGAPRLRDGFEASEWIGRALRHAIDDFVVRLQAGLWILASVASTAPFVGLFGTVWGIYHALIGIGHTGSVGLDQVAGPVGEALIMTALGLGVAIPAVLGYNALVRGHKALVHRINRFAHDLHAYLVTGARIGCR